jgi:hypothetical protein
VLQHTAGRRTKLSGFVHDLDPGDPELVYVRFLADRGG